MPCIWEHNINKVGVYMDELVPYFFNKAITLQQAIRRNREKNYGIKQLQRACYGRPMLVDFDTLPREVQQELGDPRKKSPMEKFYEVDPLATRFFYDEFKFGNGERLDGKFAKQYIINASVLNAVDAFKAAHIAERTRLGKKTKKLYELMTHECQAFQQILKSKFKTQHDLPASERAFRRVYDNYFTEAGHNYRSLISGKLMNENSKKLNDDIKGLLDSLFAKAGTKPNKKQVADRYQKFMEGRIEVINNENGEVFNPADFKLLSDRTITAWLSTWDSMIGTNPMRETDRQRTLARFSPYFDLDKPKFAGNLISVDDRQPPFEYGPSQRPWFYLGVDVMSEAITTWVYGKDKKGLILDFYREMVRNHVAFGTKLPRELEAESNLNASFKDTFLMPGAMFDGVRIEANNARGKWIERGVNRRLRYQYEKDLDGWIGRPFAKDESNQAKPASGAIGGQDSEKYIAYEVIIKRVLKQIENFNNTWHPDQTKYKGMSRWDVYMAHQNPELKPINWRAFMPHLGYMTKSSCRVAQIRLQNQNFLLGDEGSICTGEPLIRLMRQIEGQDVTLYWLDGKDGNIMKAMVYLGDKYICEAVKKPSSNRAAFDRDDDDNERRTLMSRYKATVDSYMTTRRHEIEAVTVLEYEEPVLNHNFRIAELAEDRMFAPRKQFEYEKAEVVDEPEEDAWEQTDYRPGNWKDRW